MHINNPSVFGFHSSFPGKNDSFCDSNELQRCYALPIDRCFLFEAASCEEDEIGGGGADPVCCERKLFPHVRRLCMDTIKGM